MNSAFLLYPAPHSPPITFLPLEGEEITPDRPAHVSFNTLPFEAMMRR